MKVINPDDGKAVLTWNTEASGKGDVLNAVGRLAAKVRTALGDRTLDESALKNEETFTAGSLEAAHAYVQGQELQWAGKYEDAIGAYQKAVQLDPTLGRAYAGLGAVSASLGRRDEAESTYKQAIANIDRMTDRGVPNEGRLLSARTRCQKGCRRARRLAQAVPGRQLGARKPGVCQFPPP